MELLEYICMSEYVCTVVLFIFSFKDVFILINFSPLFFHLDMHCVIQYTRVCVQWHLALHKQQGCSCRIFCEVSFVFSDCRMFAGLQHLAGLEVFLFCVANSFLIILFPQCLCMLLFYFKFKSIIIWNCVRDKPIIVYISTKIQCCVNAWVCIHS